jgi:hypothetical protein
VTPGKRAEVAPLSDAEVEKMRQRAGHPPVNPTRSNMEYAPPGMSQWAMQLASDVLALLVERQALQERAERLELQLAGKWSNEQVKWIRERDRVAAEVRVAAADEFLKRLSEWDMLFIPSHGEVVGQVADAAYWKAEIEKARAALAQVPATEEK